MLAGWQWLLRQDESVHALQEIDVLGGRQPAIDEQVQPSTRRYRRLYLRRDREAIALVKEWRRVQLAHEHLGSAISRQWDGEQLHPGRGSQSGGLVCLFQILLAIRKQHDAPRRARR